MNEKIKISFVGDINLCGNVEDNFKKKSLIADRNIYEYFQGSDIVCGNIESPISNGGARGKFKYVALKANTIMADAVAKLGVNVGTLANNHIKDYGDVAFYDTASILKTKGIKTVGVGENLKTARRPLLLKVKNKTIGILNYASSKETWASSKSYGTAREIKKEIINDIAGLDKEADIVIVSLHTGAEFESIPELGLVKNCHEYIDNGANAIICHHPHVLQGIERYKKGLIAYSLGNFIFDSSFLTNKKTKETCILTVTFEDDSVKHSEVKPVLLDDNGIPKITEGNSILDNIQRLSSSLKISELKKLQDASEENLKTQMKIIYNESKKKGIPYVFHVLRTRRLKKRHIHALFKLLIKK